jgi:hypothetical protein
MAILFRVTGTVVTGDSVSSLTPGAPAGTLATDIVLAYFIFGAGSGVTFTPPSGWTLAFRQNQTTSAGMAVYWGLGSASFTAWTISGLTAASIIAFTAGYTGVDNTTPLDVASAGQSTGGNGTVVTVPALTTVTNGAMFTGLFGYFDGTGGAGPTWGSVATLSPHITTEFTGPTTLDTLSTTFQDATVATAGAFGPHTSTLTGAGLGTSKLGIAVALRPAAIPTFRAENHSLWSNPAGGNTVINKPTGTVDGDIVVIYFVTNETSPTPPSGFVAVSGFPLAAIGGILTYVWWKLASSEPASYTITVTNGLTTQGLVVSYSGANTTTPFSPTPTNNNGVGVTSTYLGLTTSIDKGLIIALGWDFGDTQNILAAPSGTTPTFTTRYTAGGGLDLFYLGDGTLSPAGATGNKTQTNNSISTNPWVTSLLSLLGAPAASSDGYYFAYKPVQVSNRNVGPMALRALHRRWQSGPWEILPDPQTTPLPPIIIPNRNVGPAVLRARFRVVDRNYWGSGGIVGQLFTQALPAVLSFTGVTNLGLSVTKVLAAGLSFTGPTNLGKAIVKGITAGLSFTGVFIKKTSTSLVNAGLSFSGAFVKQAKPVLAGALSFTGAFTRLPIKNLTATLSFTGPANLLKAISKRIAGGLSFAGSLRKAIVVALVAASLSFTGAITKFTTRTFIAGLSFTGSISLSKVFKWAMTAGLTFTGAFIKQPNKVFTAGVSFVGTLPNRAIGKALSAGLSFTGSNIRFILKGIVAGLSFTGQFVKTIKKNLTATLSFTAIFGAIKGGVLNLISLAANLSFTGALVKQGNKVLSGGLSFTGATPIKTIQKALVAGLTFVGSNVKFVRTSLTGTLSFAGALAKLGTRTFTAVLSFTGSISRTITFNKALAATLSFAGSLASPAKRIISFAASMNSTGNLTNFRWYSGVFKETSKGLLRAAHRTIQQIITQNRNLR